MARLARPLTGPTSVELLDPLLLSHHAADEAYRCIRLGSIHVCRRCAAITAGLLAAQVPSISRTLNTFDAAWIALISVPAAAEFVATARLQIAYRPWRVLLFNPMVGLTLAVMVQQWRSDGDTRLAVAVVALTAAVFAATARRNQERRGVSDGVR